MRVYCVFVLKENIEPTRFERLKNKITFVNKKQHMYLPIGVLYVKSSLDKNGYITDITYYNDFIDKEQFLSRLKNFNPEVVALSITSEQEYNIAQSLISRIKKEKSEIKIIIGGPYSTLVPEDIMKNKLVDAVCIGEGEIAVPKYIEQVRKKEYKKTDNLYIRNNGQIIRCDKSILIEDIDSVPYPDRESWLKLFRNNKEGSLPFFCLQ